MRIAAEMAQLETMTDQLSQSLSGQGSEPAQAADRVAATLRRRAAGRHGCLLPRERYAPRPCAW